MSLIADVQAGERRPGRWMGLNLPSYGACFQFPETWKRMRVTNRPVVGEPMRGILEPDEISWVTTRVHYVAQNEAWSITGPTQSWWIVATRNTIYVVECNE